MRSTDAKQTPAPLPKPPKRLFDPDFTYVPKEKTDVKATFERHGWTAPSEARHAALINTIKTAR